VNTLSPNANLAQLAGRELLQVCVGSFQVQLWFEQRTVIAFEAIGTLEPGRRVLDSPPVAASELCQLLGRRIEAVRLDSEFNLVVDFGGTEVLTVPNDIANLESFEILVDDKRL